MTEDEIRASRPHTDEGMDEGMPAHPLRSALLDLLAELGTVTSTEAAARLGQSSGLCSFHLRQLARYGRIEEVPQAGGRARPWRLRPAPGAPGSDADTAGGAGGAGSLPGSPAEEGFGELARGLEDESHQRWLAQRDQAPPEWRRDEAFSAVVYLTPDELTAVADAVRQTLAHYLPREHEPSARPADARPVALITRLFPLLPTPGTSEQD
ncbi:ArsR/SmtB family transcription factor [Streptacidiphilus sp. N1-3]|uniref:ArsR/SmtB family transcription factor n=1 Tax=Streptacidiphilus alkalitolerans TaxID=3342712 RepID=A0ABV6WW43_9ACTN